MKDGIVRSPLFYVGDKFRLIKEIRQYFPQQINHFIEPFVGGGSVMMNVEANNYLLNDIDNYVIGIHKMLCSFVGNKETLLERMFEIIENYGLSLSLKNNTISKDLKDAFPKTYFAKYNKEAYNKLKADFNSSEKDDMITLYVLLIYGFNRMLRFNRKGEFNLPVGNVDFNKNTKEALDDYFNVLSSREVKWFNCDFRTFLHNVNFQNNDLVYLDPPYLITYSEYNKFWNKISNLIKEDLKI